jgi:hypothetical protein
MHGFIISRLSIPATLSSQSEYEKIEHHEDQRDDNDQQEIEIKLFCGDLYLAECKISVPNERNDNFELLLSSGPKQCGPCGMRGSKSS